jgi:hypothetical protein
MRLIYVPEREKLLLTFLVWPKRLTQKPEDLVDAGLNYTGSYINPYTFPTSFLILSELE